MIKKITVAQCDICGKTEPAKATTVQYNETDYVLPDNWKWSETTKEFCICYECRKKLEAPQVSLK
jgi:hypothetical protein